MSSWATRCCSSVSSILVPQFQQSATMSHKRTVSGDPQSGHPQRTTPPSSQTELRAVAKRTSAADLSVVPRGASKPGHDARMLESGSLEPNESTGMSTRLPDSLFSFTGTKRIDEASVKPVVFQSESVMGKQQPFSLGSNLAGDIDKIGYFDG